MSATILTPVTLVLTTVLTDITSATPAGKVRRYDVRYANVGVADAYGDLVLTDGVTVINRAKSYPVPYQAAGSAPDIEQGIVVPAGWKLRGKSSLATTLEASVIGVEADATDFV
jgi:hypothetical protein